MQPTYQTNTTFSYTDEHITPREIQILTLMAQGILNKEIAQRRNCTTPQHKYGNGKKALEKYLPENRISQ
jgi:FixJ family two-component response regulator